MSFYAIERAGTNIARQKSNALSTDHQHCVLLTPNAGRVVIINVRIYCNVCSVLPSRDSKLSDL